MCNTMQSFFTAFLEFLDHTREYISTDNGQWKIKGLIDNESNIFSLTNDTKLISKIIELHLLPELFSFARSINYSIELPRHQNHYPDLTFINLHDEDIKFAVDIKTTYRKDSNPNFCNGFTLGSHGRYFKERNCTKNITYPYNGYLSHFCFGIIYSRTVNVDNVQSKYRYEQLGVIQSIINSFDLFFCEKWKIASDKAGSGNTANIGSVKYIDDILTCNGVFVNLGEHIFDDYWVNYNELNITKDDGTFKKLRCIEDYMDYRSLDRGLINKPNRH
ncbi:MAG: restriction endonuclease [Candidatus Coatesbacteria bacterium]|nr:restriction endonuclease [Candidatus Coatesbacteria bacterium]